MRFHIKWWLSPTSQHWSPCLEPHNCLHITLIFCIGDFQEWNHSMSARSGDSVNKQTTALLFFVSWNFKEGSLVSESKWISVTWYVPSAVTKNVELTENADCVHWLAASFPPLLASRHPSAKATVQFPRRPETRTRCWRVLCSPHSTFNLVYCWQKPFLPQQIDIGFSGGQIFFS